MNSLISIPQDPLVKTLVLQSVLNQETSSLPSSFNSASSKTSPRSESPITCSENSSSKHIWKAEGEDVLVNLMHAKKDKLLKSQNHTALWKKISVELNETLQ